MSEEQEIAAKIGELGEQIKAAKAEKKAKEEWEPILNEMLALKVRVLLFRHWGRKRFVVFGTLFRLGFHLHR